MFQDRNLQPHSLVWWNQIATAAKLEQFVTSEFTFDWVKIAFDRAIATSHQRTITVNHIQMSQLFDATSLM